METKVQKIKCKKENFFKLMHKRGIVGLKFTLVIRVPYIPYELAIKHKDPEPSWKEVSLFLFLRISHRWFSVHFFLKYIEGNKMSGRLFLIYVHFDWYVEYISPQLRFYSLSPNDLCNCYCQIHYSISDSKRVNF